MLYLEKERVQITEEGMMLPEVKEIWNRDKHSAKPYFNKVITYLFWMYKKDGEYQNHPIKRRMELAGNMAGVNPKDMEDCPHIRKLISAYVENETTLTERLYLGIKKDINDILEYVKDIPFVVKEKVEVDVDVPKFAGSTDTVKHTIKVEVEVDNTEKKWKAMERADKLIDFEEKIRKKVIKEAQLKRSGETRKFDKR